MSYVILKKEIKGKKVNYNPIDIVESYKEARNLIESDSSLALSYSSKAIQESYNKS